MQFHMKIWTTLCGQMSSVMFTWKNIGSRVSCYPHNISAFWWKIYHKCTCLCLRVYIHSLRVIWSCEYKIFYQCWMWFARPGSARQSGRINSVQLCFILISPNRGISKRLDSALLFNNDLILNDNCLCYTNNAHIWIGRWLTLMWHMYTLLLD